MKDTSRSKPHNERITIENLRLGTQILFETVRRICG